MPVQSRDCDLFKYTVHGANKYGSSASTLVRLRPDMPQRVTRIRCEVPEAGSKADATLRIDVSFAGLRDGADVYSVSYQSITGGRTYVREFEVCYAGEPVTVVDDEYGRVELRPPGSIDLGEFTRLALKQTRW